MSPIDARLAQALADRYRLDRELGAGGMATVYLADDLKHQRKVAVKVLRPELSAAFGHERFLREITTTANLRHPHILPLFDSGEGAGFVYYVMPLVEGESLRDRLTREGKLPLDDALRISAEVADALDYAHGRGVVHRDVKPENILLENGHAVVADFGIAHAARASGDDKLTAVGMALGTPRYMSPEQAAGEPADSRSDLYALACVTYEMIAGSAPFDAPSAQALMARHAIAPVPSLAAARADAPPNVCAAIERALAKAPEERFSTLGEYRVALAGSIAATPAVGNTTPAAAIRRPPPAPSTALIGRDGALADAESRLRSGVRVLTISGYGGTGKTRFSIELFGRLEREYTGGAAFVSLASVTAPAEVLPTVGITLGIVEAHGRSPLDTLATVIGGRRVLLVLDNLEQVLGAAEDIAALVARCPSLVIVATSRAPLKIGAETEFPLPPLDLPAENAASADHLLACPSVALFVQRARKVQPSFALTKGNAAAVAAICRKLDGLPLALELAAARIRILAPDALLERLDHALDLLTSGDRDLPLRQRTLRTAISWSYSLLDAHEQRLLRRLSVFHEGWTLAAVEGVCYAQAERHRALDEVDSLVEKGLVRVMDGGRRYGLLETIRAFAAEQLHAEGQVPATRDAHAACFTGFTAQVAADIRGDAQVDAMNRARTESANCQAALQWLLGRARGGDDAATERALQLCGNLCWPWHIIGLHLTGVATVDTLAPLAAGRPPSLGRVLTQLTGAISRGSTGDWDGAMHDAEGARADALALGEDALIAEASLHIAYVHLSLGRMPEAARACDDILAYARSGKSEFLEAFGLSFKGMLVFLTGDLQKGRPMTEEALRMQERRGDAEAAGLSLSFLAQMTFAAGDRPGAVATFRRALASFERVGDRPEIARLHCEMGWAALAAGDAADASLSFQRAVHVYEEVGSPRGTGTALLGLAAVESARGNAERAVAIAAAARALSTRAGVVVDHPMDPGVQERIEALKAGIPSGKVAGLEADAATLTPAAVLELLGS
ncbi:MAG: protein kinase [Gemmatimonadota bacterium]|nr:protein kinase [Gemmatimonadota bacterium]